MSALNKAISLLDKVGIFSRWTNIIGIIALFSMILLNFVDVIMDTSLFHSPINGITALTEIMMITGIWLAIAHSQDEKGHIAIDLITSRLSPLNRLVTEFVTSLLGLGTVSIIIWKVIDQTIYFAQKHMMHAQYLNIPSAPFGVIIVIGAIALWLLMFRDFLKIIVEAIKTGISKYRWLVMVAVPIALAVLIYLFMQPDLWKMNMDLLALLGVAVFVVLLLSGLPIAFTMILTAVIFIAHIRGSFTAFDMIATDIYRASGSYAFSVLPFFMMMGFFCLHAGFGANLYDAGYKWFGHRRGGLAYATILACTFFSAVDGDPIGSISTMGPAALPQMRKYKYSDMLSTGSIIAGASLGPIIPPSSAFILVGLLTGVAVGPLLISGIVPGIVMAACYMIVIYFWCRINPNAGPAGEKSGWRPRFISLKAGGPIFVIFMVCIGGIYFGFFTPTRGGAIGAFAAVVLGLIMNRWRWKNFSQALLDGGKSVSTVFIILIGAVMFSRFLAWCNITGSISDFINALGLSPTSFVIITLAIFFIVGFAVDILPMILIGFPIFFPIAVSLGIDPIWFSLLLVIVIGLGEMTPPVGITMFVMRAMSKDIPLGTIFKGVIPFAIAQVVALVLIVLWPSLATWLPSLMK